MEAKPNPSKPQVPTLREILLAPAAARQEEQFYYSPSRRGFFSSRLHASVGLPEDKIEITREEHAALVGSGKEIEPGPGGRPRISTRVATVEEKANWKRQERDAALRATDGLVARHNDEQLLQATDTLNPVQLKQLLQYRQALRDLPKAPGFPDIVLPPNPVAGGH